MNKEIVKKKIDVIEAQMLVSEAMAREEEIKSKAELDLAEAHVETQRMLANLREKQFEYDLACARGESEEEYCTTSANHESIECYCRNKIKEAGDIIT